MVHLYQVGLAECGEIKVDLILKEQLKIADFHFYQKSLDLDFHLFM